MIPKFSKLRAAFVAGVAIAALGVSAAVVPAAKAAEPNVDFEFHVNIFINR